MKINYIKIGNLTDSWLNGNQNFVRKKVKRLNKVEFVLLCVEICSLSNNQDMDKIAFSLTYKN